MGIACGAMLFIACIFSSYYQETATLNGIMTIVKTPYAQYAFPLLIGSLISLVIGIAGFGHRKRTNAQPKN